MYTRDKHAMIQSVAKEKKQSKIVRGFQLENNMLQGSKLQEFLFNEVKNKFNPGNKEKIIVSQPILVDFQTFQQHVEGMSDKKAHGCDGLPICYLKKVGIQKAYKLFCDWTQLRLPEEQNRILLFGQDEGLSALKEGKMKIEQE